MKVLNRELVKHDYLMVTMLTQKAFEADRTEIILAESLDVFSLMDLALVIHTSASHAVD